MPTEERARGLYREYCRYVGLPCQWHHLNLEHQDAWRRAAEWVEDHPYHIPLYEQIFQSGGKGWLIAAALALTVLLVGLLT